MKYITIKDIARHLSISVSTVSRALGDDKNIRKETKEKVIEAAKRLGYRPNPVAINLKYGHTNTVGVIVPEMVTPFASRVINGIQEVLHTKNIKVIIAESGGVSKGLIQSCYHKRNKEEYARLQQAGMPMVFYDRIPYGLEVPQVIVDDYMKSFFLVESLIRSGRKQIVHIQGPDDIYNSIERVRGYKDALAKFGIPFDKNNMPIKTGMTFEEGKKAADILVERNIPFNAIFAFTETLAIGAMNRLRELGKKIPEEIAVASFSGTELSNIVYPKLTTVEPPLYQMGKKAAELILEKIKDPASPNHSIVLDAEIKMRASTPRLEVY